MKGICKLCLKEKELLKKSHIVPDFIYRESQIYDAKHRIHSFTKGDVLSDRKIKFEQSGIYVGNILCANCDNVVIGSYERYASMAIYGKAIPVDKSPKCENYLIGSETITICENVDYKQFKLFMLSILWRASIISHPFFDEVQLSPSDQERLRIMILNGDPGKENDFPFLTTTFKMCITVPNDMIISPIRVINENEIVTFKFILGGMYYCFFAGINIDVSKFSDMIMKPNNELKIFQFDDVGGQKFLKSYLETSA